MKRRCDLTLLAYFGVEVETIQDLWESEVLDCFYSLDILLELIEDDYIKHSRIKTKHNKIPNSDLIKDMIDQIKSCIDISITAVDLNRAGDGYSTHNEFLKCLIVNTLNSYIDLFGGAGLRTKESD